jgi:hypothetical protein
LALNFLLLDHSLSPLPVVQLLILVIINRILLLLLLSRLDINNLRNVVPHSRRVDNPDLRYRLLLLLLLLRLHLLIMRPGVPHRSRPLLFQHLVLLLLEDVGSGVLHPHDSALFLVRVVLVHLRGELAVDWGAQNKCGWGSLGVDLVAVLVWYRRPVRLRVGNVIGLFGNWGRVAVVEGSGDGLGGCLGGLDGALVGAEGDHDGLGGCQGHQAQQGNLEKTENLSRYKFSRENFFMGRWDFGWYPKVKDTVREKTKCFLLCKKVGCSSIITLQQEIVDIH